MPRKGIPAAAVVAVGVGVAAVLAFVLVAFLSAKRRAGHEMCQLNLRQISMAVKRGELPTAPAWDEMGTGRAFLANHPRWPSRIPIPLLDLSCPVRGVPGEIDYRGPARPLGRMRPDEPFCADRPGNHGPGRGGNVMLPSGDIYAVAEQDPLWQKAAETTRD